MFLTNLKAEIVACILSFRKSRHKPNLENTSVTILVRHCREYREESFTTRVQDGGQKKQLFILQSEVVT